MWYYMILYVSSIAYAIKHVLLEQHIVAEHVLLKKLKPVKFFMG